MEIPQNERNYKYLLTIENFYRELLANDPSNSEGAAELGLEFISATDFSLYS
jgi:hypothetical protein